MRTYYLYIEHNREGFKNLRMSIKWSKKIQIYDAIFLFLTYNTDESNKRKSHTHTHTFNSNRYWKLNKNPYIFRHDRRRWVVVVWKRKETGDVTGLRENLPKKSRKAIKVWRHWKGRDLVIPAWYPCQFSSAGVGSFLSCSERCVGL